MINFFRLFFTLISIGASSTAYAGKAFLCWNKDRTISVSALLSDAPNIRALTFNVRVEVTVDGVKTAFFVNKDKLDGYWNMWTMNSKGEREAMFMIRALDADQKTMFNLLASGETLEISHYRGEVYINHPPVHLTELVECDFRNPTH